MTTLAPRPLAPMRRLRLSERAWRLDLLTVDDLWREFHAAKEGWTKGTDYHCAICDKDFCSPSGARRHMKVHDHPVLRWDWY